MLFFLQKVRFKMLFQPFFVADKTALDLQGLRAVGMRCNLWYVLLISGIFSFFKTNQFTQAITDWMVSIQR